MRSRCCGYAQQIVSTASSQYHYSVMMIFCFSASESLLILDLISALRDFWRRRRVIFEQGSAVAPVAHSKNKATPCILTRCILQRLQLRLRDIFLGTLERLAIPHNLHVMRQSQFTLAPQSPLMVDVSPLDDRAFVTSHHERIVRGDGVR